ncbi:hypothetical protein FH972_009353 [Carpinus fangiana]|uniref:Uncharacterized protein n=1 Tax=Carpinus fangiana TaxID=176857 RepID=A0A5N6R4Q0_9ROSI|nr:hypothetical protein FH972_009353 [Carpinus fangiana]
MGQPGVNHASSEEFGLSPVRLLGPPEVPPVNSYPDYTQDPIRDRLGDWRLGIESPCLFFCSSFIYKQSLFTLRKEYGSTDVLQHFLELSWSHCPQTTLKLICLLRRTGLFSKQCREDFYTAAIWLHRYHSQTLAYNVGAFAKFGWLKDLLEILYRILNGLQVRHNQIMGRDKVRDERQKAKMIVQRQLLHKIRLKKMNSKEILIRTRKLQKRLVAEIMKPKVLQERSVTHSRNKKRIMMAKKAIERYNHDPNYRYLHDQIANLFAKLLKADLECLISGQMAKISLASKWCPSLDSSYDRSTLFCESVARRLFPYNSCPEYRELDVAHYTYRIRNRLQKEVLVPLRRALGLLEIYMSARQWNLLRYDRIASNAMKTYKRLFYKHDHDEFLRHLQNVPKTSTKELYPHDILRLLGCDSGHEVADLQWKRMIDTYFSKGKFVNCISVVDAALFRRGIDCTERFCLAFPLMTSELCASPWKGTVLTYSNNPTFVNIEGKDLGSRISFLSSLPMGKCPKLVQLLEKILEIAIDLKLSKENMIERIFVFDHWGNCFSGWVDIYERMREKYERNGYVMPKFVHWNHHDRATRTYEDYFSVKGDLTEIIATESSFRNFLESNGTLSPMAVMESKICGEDYLKVVVHD